MCFNVKTRFILAACSINLLISTNVLGNTTAEENSTQVHEYEATEVVDLKPVVVSASRLSQPFVNQSFAENVAVETSDHVEGIAQQLSGAILHAPLGLSGVSEFIVRGGEANFSKVLVDGIEVNNPMDSRGGGVSLMYFDVLPFSGVELSKGSMSSLSGSGAISGVLSMEVEQPGDSMLNALTAEIGSFGYSRIGATVGYRLPKTPISAQLGYNRVEENDRYEDHDFNADAVHFKATYKSDRGRQLSVSSWKIDLEQARLPEDSGGILYAENNATDQIDADLMALSLRFEQSFESGSMLSLNMGHFAHDQVSDSPGVAGGLRNPYGVPANSFDDAFERNQVELSFRHFEDEHYRISVGSSFFRERGVSASEVTLYPGFSLPGSYDVERDLLSVFAEGSVEFMEQHLIHAAERLDKVSGQDSEWSGSLRYVYRANVSKLNFFVAYSEAFKAPSLFALNNALVGNPELDAETSESWEAGILGANQNEDLNWKLSFFSQNYENLIDLQEATQTMGNLCQVKMQGAELSVNYTPTERFWLGIQGSLLNIDLEDSEEILRFRPEQLLRLEFGINFTDSQSVSIRYQYMGKRWDSSIPTGNIELKADHELSAAWQADLGDFIELYASLRNLLDRDNEVMVGYEKSGISASVGARLRF